MHDHDPTIKSHESEQPDRLPDIPVYPERVSSVMGVDEALALAGFSTVDYFVSPNVKHWAVKASSNKYVSDDGMGLRSTYTPATAWMARKARDGRWEIGQTAQTGEDMVRAIRVDMYNSHGGSPLQATAKSVLEDMGVSDETRQRVADEIARRREIADNLFEQEKIQYAVEVKAAIGRFRELPVAGVLPYELKERMQPRFEPDARLLQDLVTWAHEVQPLFERQQAGEILVNWNGWCRTGGANDCGYAYVIDAQGKRVEPDTVKHYGMKGHTDWWDIVEPEQLAVAWSKGTKYSSFRCRVAKAPVEGLTSQQQEALRAIETAYDMPLGSWETDETLTAERHAVVEAVRSDDVCAAFLEDAMQEEGNADVTDDGRLYNMLMSLDGVYGGWTAGDYRSTSDDVRYDVDGRKATAQHKVQISATHAAAILVYEKYGHWNKALRLVEIDSQEIEPVARVAVEMGSTAVAEATELDLSALRERFRK